jgi:hypothetical protein
MPTHLQKYERRKLGPINKTDASTSIITQGDTLIGDLLNRSMLLIPFVIDPLGRFGPLLQNFLFGHHPAPLLWFPPSRPNATQMYSKLLNIPVPKAFFSWQTTTGHSIPLNAFMDTLTLYPLLI